VSTSVAIDHDVVPVTVQLAPAELVQVQDDTPTSSLAVPAIVTMGIAPT
jgi:hypothetical protein